MVTKIPIYDLKCNFCDDIQEDIFLKLEDKIPDCQSCGEKRVKICNCKHFKLVYNSKTDTCSWGNEGYSTTQRYRYVNKDKVIE